MITRTNHEKGQALTEFALVLPFICFLLFAVVAYGNMIWASMDLTSATRDGARRAAVARVDTSMPPSTQVQSTVRNSLDRVSESDVSITINGGWNRDDTVTVTTTMPYTLRVMGVQIWNGSLSAKSMVRIG